MRKVLFLLADVAVVVGGVIGAGFASGEEISLYFHGKNALFSSLAAALMFFCVFYVFLSAGERLGAGQKTLSLELQPVGYSATARILRGFLLFNYFTVLCSMLAGANVTLSALFSTGRTYFVFGAVTALVCGVILFFDMNGIRRFSNLVVPFILLLIVIVCLLNSGYGTQKGVGGAGSAAMYVSMNCVIMSGILLSLGEKKETNKFAVSCISAVVLSLLLFLIITRVNSVDSAITMPLLYYAYLLNADAGALMSVVIYFAIITTVIACAYPLVQWLKPLLHSKILAISSVFLAALVVSLVGFSKIVAFVYPVISILGTAVIALYILLYLSLKIQAKRATTGTMRNGKNPKKQNF